MHFGMESGIQKVGIRKPDAGIRNLEAGIQNPGPSQIPLHRAKRTNLGKYQAYWLVLVSLLLYNIMDTVQQRPENSDRTQETKTTNFVTSEHYQCKPVGKNIAAIHFLVLPVVVQNHGHYIRTTETRTILPKIPLIYVVRISKCRPQTVSSNLVIF